MNPQTAVTLIRRYYEQALTHADWATLDAITTPAFVEHEILPNIPPTVAGLKQKYDLLRTGFPDLNFTIEDILTASDRVAVRVTVRGTHTGMFMGRPATGRVFAVTSVSIFRIASDRIVEHWGVFDQMAMLAQLGTFPGAA